MSLEYFDYYYGSESEQFIFYRIPKVLFTEPRFKKVSCEAKVLYGILLDRMQLSRENKWFDEENRVYIIYTVDEVIETLGFARQKVVKLLAELDTDKGIGLIEKKRLGQGRANIIYVKNFIHESEQGVRKHATNPVDTQKYENHTSRSSNFILPEVPKSYSNNTKDNNTKSSDNQSINQEPKEKNVIDGMMDMIHENIEYDILCDRYERESVDELADIMIEVIATTSERITIGKNELPSALVKSRMMKLDSSHIQYVLNSMLKTRTKITNIKSYLLTALFNSSMTINHHYQQEVNYDHL